MYFLRNSVASVAIDPDERYPEESPTASGPVSVEKTLVPQGKRPAEEIEAQVRQLAITLTRTLEHTSQITSVQRERASERSSGQSNERRVLANIMLLFSKPDIVNGQAP